MTTGASTVATYAYDGDALRLSKTVGATTTNFTWDESQGLPLVAEDGTDRYLYGPLGEPIERITGSGVTTFIHQDHLGSTRLLTNSAGSISGTYDYRATGPIGTHAGGISVTLQYAGQYTDAETGFIYLRARYYHPNTGQFLTQDPIVSTTQEAYGYAGGNSINRTDPSGRFPIPIDSLFTYSVYGLVRAGKVVYIGITRRPVWVRSAEHLAVKQQQGYFQIEDGLTRMEARGSEQALINEYGLENLDNAINSIGDPEEPAIAEAEGRLTDLFEVEEMEGVEACLNEAALELAELQLHIAAESGAMNESFVLGGVIIAPGEFSPFELE